MEMGLNVDFDGKKNVVLGGGIIKEYPIGGMICEYARFRPTDLKEPILENSHFHDVGYKDTMPDALLELYEKLLADHGPITAHIVVTEISDYLLEYLHASEDACASSLAEMNAEKDDKINTFILEDSGHDCFGLETVGQALLTAYSFWASSYVAFKFSFNMLVTGDEYEEAQVNGFWSMYGDNTDFQHIAFRIMNFDGSFHSIYTIKSSLSLLLFETAHVINEDTKIVKCKNCGEYFVPIGRSDAVYCGYPSPQEPDKACREIGARNTRARKMKNDTATIEYRKLYMRLKMAIQRHPDSLELQQQFKMLSEEVKRIRSEIKTGHKTADDLIEWLTSFEATLNKK